ncbi:MAG: hypothetical protein COA38_00790 [Fluviicola sp.]|nr:MAG: hypothetical protein COA38_00790 [Fluviicola sp.]
MRKFKFYATSLLILSILFIGFSSCKKVCKIEADDVDSGLIVESVAIYPLHGYITQEMSDEYHVHDASSIAHKFKMSTDNGFTQSPFNYGEYSILAYPMTLNCSFSIVRDVRVNDANMTATYTITVTQCKNPECSEQRYIENFIAVPAIPESYTILHDISIVEQ